MAVVQSEDLVGISEIAELLQVSPNYAHQLSLRSGFPEPIARLVATRIWDRWQVEEWAESRGKPRRGRPGKEIVATEESGAWSRTEIQRRIERAREHRRAKESIASDTTSEETP